MNIGGVNARTSIDPTIGGSQVRSKNLNQQDFLKLMVEQMKNQNPLEPQDNSEFFTQIAQFDTLDAMKEMVAAINRLATLSDIANGAMLVGKTVTASVPQGPDPETGMPRPPRVTHGTVSSVTFGSSGPVAHIGNLPVPLQNVVEVA